MTDLSELLTFRPQHLAWPVPANVVEQIGETDARVYLEGRRQRIVRSELDPLRYGFEPDIWQTVRAQIADLRAKYPEGVIKIIIWGGNRSSKTRFAANYVNRDCNENPGRRWWCCDSTEAQARANQMRLINEQFPPEWRDLPRGKIADVRYSLSDGYPKNKLVCPNASEVDFKFYSMDIANLPGPELDGIWCDELVPLVWVETLIYRLINRNGLLLVTFTPELGWNETYGYFYEGAQALDEVDAPLLPKYDGEGRLLGYKQVPRVMQCTDPMARIVYFHTEDNPFSNYPALVQQLKNKSEEEILIRAYGVCSKSHHAAFPTFSQRWHVITEAQFLALTKKFPQGSRFHLLDPCSGRRWFMIWVFCPHPDKWIIYREWPSTGHMKAYIKGVGIPGPWALSGAAADGVKGPGQDSDGWGLERYKEEIEDKEAGENVMARYMDSRYGTEARLDRERATTLIEQMAEVGMDFLAMVPGKGRIIAPEGNDGSIDLINSALYYDPETEKGKWSKELGRLNEPQLLVCETCPNTIYALEHWTGEDGQRGACKDPVDVVRGLFLSSVNHMDGSQYTFVGGGIPR